MTAWPPAPPAPPAPPGQPRTFRITRRRGGLGPGAQVGPNGAPADTAFTGTTPDGRPVAYHRATDLEMTRTIAVWGPGLPTAVVHGLVPDAPARNEVVLHLIDGRRVSGRIGDDTAIRSLADAGRAVRGLLGPHGPLTRRGNALPLTTAEHTWVLTRESARGLVVHRREGGGEAGDRGGTGDRGETGAPIEVARTSGDVLELAAAATPLDVVAALTLHAFRVDTSVLASLGA